MKVIKSTIIVTIPVPDAVSVTDEVQEEFQERYLRNKLFSNTYTVLDVTSKVVEKND